MVQHSVLTWQEFGWKGEELWVDVQETTVNMSISRYMDGPELILFLAVTVSEPKHEVSGSTGGIVVGYLNR